MKAWIIGKRTIFVALGGGFLAALPDWVQSMPADSSVLEWIVSFAKTFWPALSIVFGALKIERLINAILAGIGLKK